jgi:acetyl-CoA acyltransferase
VFALPTALERAKVKLEDIGVIEMHEAFAAQVLSNIQWLGSKKIAQEKLGRTEPIGDIDPKRSTAPAAPSPSATPSAPPAPAS